MHNSPVSPMRLVSGELSMFDLGFLLLFCFSAGFLFVDFHGALGAGCL